MQKKRLIKWSSRFVGVLLFVYILSRVDISQTVSSFSGVSPGTWLAVAAICFAILLVKAARWMWIMKAQGIELSLRETVLIHFSSTFLGMVTLGRLGEFIKIAYLMERGYAFTDSLCNVILDRSMDIAVLFGIFLVALPALSDALGPAMLWCALAAGVFFCLVTAVLFFADLRTMAIRFLMKLGVFIRYRPTIRAELSEFLVRQQGYRQSFLALAVATTLLSWCIYLFMYFMLASRLGIQVSSLYLTGCVTASLFISMIPISISGIGTRDVALIYLLGHIGISNEKAVAFSFSFLCVNAIVSLYGMVCWFILPPWTRRAGIKVEERR